MNRPADPLIGTVVEGRWRVDARIGAGGMGAVYRAHQLSTGRDVAVKVLMPGLSGEEVAQRFLNEGRAIALLRSPHTLKLIDSGQMPSGQLYIVTELLMGSPLNLILKDGPIGIRRTLSFLQQVSSSLEEAHAAGIIHRDLKPANLFVEQIGSQEHLKVLDFGIAKLAQQPSLTASGFLLGTPAYMSPEQAKSGSIDATSDLYSLGVIAFECLNGEPPFRAENTFALLMKQMNDPPPPIDTGMPELDQLVGSLLSKTPSERPTSAAELRVSLQRLERRVADDDHPPSPSLPAIQGDVSLHSPGTLAESVALEVPGDRNRGLVPVVIGGFAAAAAVWFGVGAWTDRAREVVAVVADSGPKVAPTSEPPPIEPVLAAFDHTLVEKNILEAKTAVSSCAAAQAKVGRTGRADVMVTIDPSGRPVKITLKPDAWTKEPLAACIASVVEAWRFPEFSGAPASFDFPIQVRVVKAEVPVAPGRVTIKVLSSNGRIIPATISIAGHSHEAEEALMLAIPAGSYLVEIRPTGYPIQRRKVDVQSGKEVTLRVTVD